jgi:hypothetical protein
VGKGFSTNRTVWLNNGYGVEFVTHDQHSIFFSVITERDQTLVEDIPVCIGSDSCNRAEDESDRDFSIRTRLVALLFAEEMIEEHKEALALSAVLDEVIVKGTTE